MWHLPKAVHLMEVGPRDGLQIEPRILTTEQKLDLLDAIAEAGVTEIEAGSFVNPKVVPQMADTEEVFARLQRRPGVTCRALWLKPRDTVLDCFGGSGTTMIVAERTGWRAVLLEIDPAYADVIVRRWQETTGEVAVLEGDDRIFADVAAARGIVDHDVMQIAES